LAGLDERGEERCGGRIGRLGGPEAAFGKSKTPLEVVHWFGLAAISHSKLKKTVASWHNSFV
jgi:hypothetical protein